MADSIRETEAGSGDLVLKKGGKEVGRITKR